jgi:hypothetical protein
MIVDEVRLKKILIDVCEIAPITGQGPAVRCGSTTATTIVAKLKALSEVIQSVLASAGKRDLIVKPTTGNGYLPRVLWVAIMRSKASVSNQTALVICFGKSGNGLVIGLMPAQGFGAVVVRRSQNKKRPDFINIDGVSAPSKYNDRFKLFEEFPTTNIDAKKFIEFLLEHVDQISSN